MVDADRFGEILASLREQGERLNKVERHLKLVPGATNESLSDFHPGDQRGGDERGAADQIIALKGDETDVVDDFLDAGAAPEDDEGEAGVVYTFNMSMWDAAMLLAFRPTKTAHKIILAFGCLINLSLQLLLLLVIGLDMLDNDFKRERVEELLDWRVTTGHGHQEVDPITGKTLVERLCERSLWTFEQAEYHEMWKYLEQPMPGWSLTILALTLWILTVSVEFRGLLEQSLAVLSLPLVRGTEVGLKQTEDGFEVVGMRRGMKIVTALFLLLPRLLVLGSLAGVGCVYLAQTVSLHDIVLNSLALAFVLDVDELVAEVLLPTELKTEVEEIKTIKVGKSCKLCDFHLSDLFRYTVAAGLLLFACLWWLRPFHFHVQAAAQALCAGNTAFSQTGGNQETPRIVLLDTHDFISECSATVKQDYLTSKKYYGIKADYIFAGEITPAKLLEDRRMKATLQYAFSGCPSGEAKTGKVCKPVAAKLMDMLPGGVAPGNPEPPRCQRFRPEQKGETCRTVGPSVSCASTWRAFKCEHLPPGNWHKRACDTSTKKKILDSCHVWEELFKQQHPFLNCTACCSV